MGVRVGWLRWQYRLALVLLLFLVVVCVFGGHLMRHGITPDQKIVYLHRLLPNGKVQLIPPPLPPDAKYWFGTDHRGYDMYSLIVNGAFYTLGFGLLVTIVRFGLGSLIGLWAGVSGRLRGSISLFHSVTSSVPALIFIYPAMYALQQVLLLNSGLPPNDPRELMFVYVLFALLVLIGVFPLADQIAERTSFYSGKLYVFVARMMGASTSRIILRHIVPHQRAEMLFAFLTDFAQVLFLIGQLAVLGIFIGGGELFTYDDNHTYVLTTTGEWGALIAYGVKCIRSYPWIITAPSVALCLSILIVLFFAKQLQKRLERPYLYVTKPFWRNRTLLVVGTVLAAALMVWVDMTQSLAPTAIPASATGKQQTSLLQEQANKQTKTMQKNLVQTAKDFTDYLAQGNWKYAADYLYTGNRRSLATPQQPIAPFDQWIKAFQSGNYKFLDVGKKITKGKAVQMGRIREDSYLVELRVQNPQGQEETWLVEMSNNQVFGGIGGPKL